MRYKKKFHKSGGRGKFHKKGRGGKSLRTYKMSRGGIRL
jgi:hypothetical protein